MQQERSRSGTKASPSSTWITSSHLVLLVGILLWSVSAVESAAGLHAHHKQTHPGHQEAVQIVSNNKLQRGNRGTPHQAASGAGGGGDQAADDDSSYNREDGRKRLEEEREKRHDVERIMHQELELDRKFKQEENTKKMWKEEVGKFHEVERTREEKFKAPEMDMKRALQTKEQRDEQDRKQLQRLKQDALQAQTQLTQIHMMEGQEKDRLQTRRREAAVKSRIVTQSAATTSLADSSSTSGVRPAISESAATTPLGGDEVAKMADIAVSESAATSPIVES